MTTPKERMQLVIMQQKVCLFHMFVSTNMLSRQLYNGCNLLSSTMYLQNVHMHSFHTANNHDNDMEVRKGNADKCGMLKGKSIVYKLLQMACTCYKNKRQNNRI